MPIKITAIDKAAIIKPIGRAGRNNLSFEGDERFIADFS